MVSGAQYLPVPVQQPRIPVWAGCTIPHTAPLRRAARWDGVILASINETGGIDPVPVEAVREALDVVADHRDHSADPLTVAVGHPGLPSDDELKELADAGVDWALVTGWLNDIESLVGSVGERKG